MPTMTRSRRVFAKTFATVSVIILILLFISRSDLRHNDILAAKNKVDSYEVYQSKPETLLPALTLHKKVAKSGIKQHKQRLEGSLFDRRGIVNNITAAITTELVFSFSPATETNFAEKLVDPNHEQKVYANSPAMIWDGEKFVVVMRMWLDKETTKDKTSNVFQDNYFYTQSFKETMEEIGEGRILGIPTRVHTSEGDGPIEPRAFPFHNNLYLSFNSAVYVGKRLVDTTMFWNFQKDKFVMPEILDGQPQLKRRNSIPRDKHWSPYTLGDEVYMIYSLDPLRIISCDRDAKCKFTQNHANSGYQFKDVKDCLRGGTPTLRYRDDFYITIAHATLFKEGWKRYYTINLAVLKTTIRNSHQLIYLSAPIHFDPQLMDATPMVRTKFIKDPFFFPVTLLLEDEDNIIIGGHINDHSSYLFRVKGIKPLMNQIIDQSNSLQIKGPANGFLHQLTRSYAIKETGYRFKM